MDSTRRRFLLGCSAVGITTAAGCLEAPSESIGNNTSCDSVDLPLVDTPPHSPSRPPQPAHPEDEAEWNEHYLGESLLTDGDLSFDRIHLRFTESQVHPPDYDGESVFFAELFTSRDGVEQHVEPVGEESTARVDSIDFDNELLVGVLSGFGSSSVRHEWARVDTICEHLHIHGYYRQPYVQTSDYTTRVSGIVIERPDTFSPDNALISLTVEEDKRVNFPVDGEVHVVNGGDTDPTEPSQSAAIDNVRTVSVSGKYKGEWWHDGTDNTGMVAQLTSEEEVRALTVSHEDVDRFIIATDFSEDTVFFIESVGPNACYREVTVSEIVPVANDEYFIQGDAMAIDTAAEGEACAEVISYPAVLVQIKSDLDFSTGEFRIIDGWNNEQTVSAKSASDIITE